MQLLGTAFQEIKGGIFRTKPELNSETCGDRMLRRPKP